MLVATKEEHSPVTVLLVLLLPDCGAWFFDASLPSVDRPEAFYPVHQITKEAPTLTQAIFFKSTEIFNIRSCKILSPLQVVRMHLTGILFKTDPKLGPGCKGRDIYNPEDLHGPTWIGSVGLQATPLDTSNWGRPSVKRIFKARKADNDQPGGYDVKSEYFGCLTPCNLTSLPATVSIGPHHQS